MHRPGIRRIHVPLQQEDVHFLRTLANHRGTSIAQELARICTEEIGRLRQCSQRQVRPLPPADASLQAN